MPSTRISPLLALTALTLGLTGCPEKDESPLEKAGEKIEDASDKAGDGVEQAGEKIEDAVEK